MGRGKAVVFFISLEAAHLTFAKVVLAIESGPVEETMNGRTALFRTRGTWHK